LAGNSFPARNDTNILNALLGWINGTSCPAPLIVANVSPSYTSDHPPTCKCKEVVKLPWQQYRTASAEQQWSNEYLTSCVPWVPADLSLQTKVAEREPRCGHRDDRIRVTTAFRFEIGLRPLKIFMLHRGKTLPVLDSSAYLNTHILIPAFISILYVGSMDNSESFHVLMSTSLPMSANKSHVCQSLMSSHSPWNKDGEESLLKLNLQAVHL
jgi:hypothetical protein